MELLSPLAALLVTVGPIVLAFYLAWRLVRALERIADKVERMHDK